MIETGWLLDDGKLCMGLDVVTGKLWLVPYTDSSAIRFARSLDATNMRIAAFAMGAGYVVRAMDPVEHQWG